nr:hypothetical protein [Listeria grandensis]
MITQEEFSDKKKQLLEL